MLPNQIAGLIYRYTLVHQLPILLSVSITLHHSRLPESSIDSCDFVNAFHMHTKLKPTESHQTIPSRVLILIKIDLRWGWLGLASPLLPLSLLFEILSLSLSASETREICDHWLFMCLCVSVVYKLCIPAVVKKWTLMHLLPPVVTPPPVMIKRHHMIRSPSG